jgi:two-component system sensor histidine kinase DesK
MGVLTAALMPGIGLVREPDARWVALGALGIGIFAVAQAGVLYLAVTPWLTERTRRRLLAGFVAATVVSVPLVGPVAAGRWATWAWLGASVVGTVPLLLGPGRAILAAVATVAVAVGVARWTGGSVTDHLVITIGFGLGFAAVSWVQVWFWDLLVRAQEGRAAQALLAATQERLRFARDVHDLLGHDLSVIALKAELAARLATVDPERAGREAAEVRRLAASALTDLRATVHGYRVVELREQVTAVARVLRSSGVRCTVSQPDGELPADIVAQLVPVIREASTNVLRHSRAGWCAITITTVPGRDGDGHDVRMTVANDGVVTATPDPHSYGLRGLADRLSEAGGTLRFHTGDGVFTLDVTVRAAR